MFGSLVYLYDVLKWTWMFFSFVLITIQQKHLLVPHMITRPRYKSYLSSFDPPKIPRKDKQKSII